MPLYIAGYDAAGETTSQTKTIYVDNSTPTLSLSGPTDAPSTAGTQYVTANCRWQPLRDRRDRVFGRRQS